jgi:hypothetical protein
MKNTFTDVFKAIFFLYSSVLSEVSEQNTGIAPRGLITGKREAKAIPIVINILSKINLFV